MKITHQLTDGMAVIAVRGELTFEDADSLAGTITTLIERGAGDAILDMSQLAFIDSRGLSVLLDTKQKFESVSGRMIIAGLSDMMRRVLHVTRLEPTLELSNDVEEAVDLLRKSDCRVPGGRRR